MNIPRALKISALFAALSTTALASEVAPQDRSPAPKENSPKPAESAPADGATALPSLPLFELHAQASDSARLHVGLAHARRDTHRAEHTRQASGAAAREHRSAAPLQKEAAQLRRADADSERRAQAEERRAAALLHREAAAERRLNAQNLRAAAEERRASAGQK